MIPIIAKLRRGGPTTDGDEWALEHLEKLVVCASRMPASEPERYLLRASIHRMCVQHKLLGIYVPLFDSLERDETTGEPVSDSHPFYVTNVTFPVVEVATPTPQVVSPAPEIGPAASERYAALFAV